MAKKHKQLEGVNSPKYDDLKHLHGIIAREDYEYITKINENTLTTLGNEWEDHLTANKKLWKKSIPMKNGLFGLGKNKATIGIGSGQSFNINKDVLQHYVTQDGVKPWPERDFITISANHQFKPLLNMGIIPDFVLLVDASDVVYEQLCKDIPPYAKSILITGVHASPKVLKEWHKQGRDIVFYLNPAPRSMQTFHKIGLGKHHKAKFKDLNITGEQCVYCGVPPYTGGKKFFHRSFCPYNYKIDLGGNVLNGAWMIALTHLQSYVYMAVGNDLSFPIKKSVEDQRKAYYADGDYSSNAKGTGTGRDEAATWKKWAGFKLSKKQIWTPNSENCGVDKYNVKLDLVGTSGTLWVYKNWLETAILSQLDKKTSFHYYNCSEGGILGVMCKDRNPEAMKKPENWYMFDKVAVNKHSKAKMYHTAMLEDALNDFIKARRQFLWQKEGTRQIARYAENSAALNTVDTAPSVMLR
jgi:hypothetical protein